MASIHKKKKKDGTYTYFVVFRDNKGKQRWKRAENYEDAKNIKTKTEYSLLVGTYTDSGKMTFGVLAELWLEEHVKNLRPSTRRGYKSYLDAIILPEFKNVKLSMITREACQSFKRSLMKKRTKRNTKLSEQSIKHVFAIMRSIFNWAIKQGFVSSNPLLGVELPRIPKRHVDVLSIEELLHLVECTDKDYKPLIATAALSGMRVSESLGLIWDDIDFIKRTIRIERSYDAREGSHQPTKTKSSRRIVPIIKPLYDILLAHHDECRGLLDEHVFKGKNGKPLVYYHRAYKRALTKAGLQDITFHDLRHSFLSVLDSMGVRLTMIKEVAGHSSISVTADIYNHQTMKDIDDLRLMIDKDLKDS